jgi:hypothetical protein
MTRPLRTLAPPYAALLLQAVVTAQPVHATASGCTLVAPKGSPHQESLNAPPDCDLPGNGCYQCAYHNSGAPNFTLCAELPDGSGPLCDVFSEIPPGWPEADPGLVDPNPGAPPPDAPPPDSPDPGNGGGDGGGDQHGCLRNCPPANSIVPAVTLDQFLAPVNEMTVSRDGRLVHLTGPEDWLQR